MKKVMLCDAYVCTEKELEHTIPAGSIVEVVQQAGADSLVSHPDCKGFFMWNKDLGDMEVNKQ